MAGKPASDILVRLRKIEGQIRGLQGMIERGEDCQAVITQLSAARKALDKVGFLILAHKMRECMGQRASNQGREAALEEAMEMFLTLA